MAELLAERAARPFTDDLALTDDRVRLTWAELNLRVNRWMHLLERLRIGPGDTLALMAQNRAEVFELVLAVIHRGCVLVPVSWQLTADEVAYLLGDSGATLLVCDPERGAVATDACALVERPIQLVSLGDDAEQRLAACSAAEPADQQSGALLMYTSGTTGRPKGVLNGLFVAGSPLDRIRRQLDYAGRMLAVPDHGTNLLVGPWYHSAQLYFALLPLLRGVRLVLHPRFDAERLLDTIDREQVSITHLVPTHFVRLLRLPDTVRDRFRGDRLEVVWHGGGPCSVEVKQQMLDWWGDCLVEYYGATEGGAATMITAAEARQRPGSVGRALYPSQLLVVDEQGAAVPAGDLGRVFVSRRHGFAYHGDPAKTSAAHLGNGIFTYGELGYLDDDGYLYLAGRSSDVIVSGGVNVYPAEVEAALLACPQVSDAAVVGTPDVEFGELVLAYVQPADPALAGAGLSAAIEADLRTRLAGFKLPRRYVFVSPIPRDEAGKLRAGALSTTGEVAI